MRDQVKNIKFVQEVEKYPCLYNYKLPEYSRKDIVEKAWSEVGKKINMSVTSCKKKWKNLRAVLARRLKTHSCRSSTKAKKPYYLTNIMQFVLPYIKIAGTPDPEYSPPISPQNDKSQEFMDSLIKNEEDDSLILSTLDDERYTYKQKLDKEEDQLNSKRRKNMSDVDNNPRKMFLLSLLPEIDEMTEAQMKLFKRRILGLIDEITSENPQGNPYSHKPQVD